MQSKRRAASAASIALLAMSLVGGPATAVAPSTEPSGMTPDGGMVVDGTSGSYRMAHRMQHDAIDGHLPASSDNVRLVGKMRINQDEEGRVADVGVLGDYAYLAAWSAPDCQKGGIYVFNISNPAAPKQINFIRTLNDSYVGEGVQALHLSTAEWTGDLLAVNHETCTNNAGKTSAHAIGGFSLIDVSNPKVHKNLVQGFGDHVDHLGTVDPDAHEYHSVFVWEDDNFTATDADDRAYLMATDNEDLRDVDIFDITNPSEPVMVAEYDLAESFPQIVQDEGGLNEIFLHDMNVKKIGSIYQGTISYWDAGYVQLDVTDPANATYIGDSDFAIPDPVLLERTGTSMPPEGNGHESEFTLDNQFIVAADEDFGPYKAIPTITDGPFAGHTFTAINGSDVPPIDADTSLVGDTRGVGLACDAGSIPAPDATHTIAVIERGVCDFTVKVQNVEAAGYTGAIVFNRTGIDGCEALIFMSVEAGIPAIFVSRTDGFRILGASLDGYTCSEDGTGTAAPAAGTDGSSVNITAIFDGWGYVRVFRNGSGKLVETDQYAIPEAHDPAFASGFGDLSVHEAATSQVNPNLVYFSYYAGGFRVAEIDPATGAISEVGHFIDEGGNNFWGVQVWQKDGHEYVLASDRDYGLYIFEYTP